MSDGNGDDRSDEERRRVPVVLSQQGFEIQTIEQAWRFAQGLIEGRMVPESLAKGGPGAVVGIMQAGREIGVPMMAALSGMTFTNGRLGVMGDLAIGVIRAKGGLQPGTDFEVSWSGEPFTPEWTCTVTAHPVRTDKPVSESWTFAEAIRANLVRVKDGKVEAGGRNGWNTYGPWATYTRRMMYYRPLGFLVRDHFSHLLSGAVIAEELADYPRQAGPDERDVTPPREPDPLMAMLAASTGVEETASRQGGGPEGPFRGSRAAAPLKSTEHAMPQQATPVLSSPAATPEPPETAPESEVDPETGEVIPEDLPREPAGDPREAEGFVHAGKAAAEIVDELLKEPLEREHPFDATPAELAAEAERVGAAAPDVDVTRISSAARAHLVGVLAARGKKTPADALRFLGTLIGRQVRSMEDVLVHEYETVLRSLGEKVPSHAVQEALL